MAKVAVCGDSFSAVSKILPGTHYSELLADQLGWELLNYARRGCSNGGIRVQINEAIKQQADFVIIVPTSWDRMEIPAEGVPYHKEHEGTGWGHPLQDHLLDTKNYNGYHKELGVSNINYSKQQTSTMIFETIFTLAENYDHEYRAGKLDKETHRAIVSYVNHIYDSNWKRQLDQWIIVEGLMQLYSRGIKFSVETGLLWDHYPITDLRNDVPAIIDDIYVRSHEQSVQHSTGYLYPLANTDDDPGYHGTLASQEHIATMFYDLIKNKWQL